MLSIDAHGHPGLIPLFASESLAGHGARMQRSGPGAAARGYARADLGLLLGGNDRRRSYELTASLPCR